MTSEASGSPLSQAEQIFKELVWDELTLAGEVALETSLPFLKLPVLNQLERGIIGLTSGWVFNQLTLFTDVTAIQLSNDVHQAAYEKASVTLGIIAHDYGPDSKEYQNARDAARTALSIFTQFNK